MITQRTTTYLLLIASMALWGGTWIAGRVLAQSMSPMNAAFLRFLLASLFLFFLTRKVEGRFPRIGRGQILPVVGLGATGVFLYSWLFFTGLRTVTAGRAALIVACIPVCISAVSALIFKERFGPVRIIGTLLSLAGVSVVLADGNPLTLLQGGISFGDLCILGCVAAWTAYSLGGREVMKQLSPLTSVSWSCLFGCLLLFPFALGSDLVGQVAASTSLDWVCIVYLSILATSLAYYWYYSSIREIGASRSGIFINLVPVFAVALGALLLGEAVHLSLVFGGAMVVTGVYMTNRP